MSIDGTATPATGGAVADDAADGTPTDPGAAPAGTTAGAPLTPGTTPPVTASVWRYRLDVMVGEAAGSKVWQATDPVLGRRVGVRLLPSADERAADLREAACLAARVSDRRLIHVLDVVDVRFDGTPHLAIVTEWVAGRPLPEALREPLPSADALRLVADVAECLAACHDDGIAHGRLRPSSVLLTDSGDVRVRGVGVDAVLRGSDPSEDPATADVHGVGALLYACTTGRWPYGEVEGLAAAPEMGGGVPLPSRVAPAVSASVDSLCARTVTGCPPAKEGAPIRRMAVLASALRAAAGVAKDAPTAAPRARRPRRVIRRLVAAVAGLVAVGGLAIVGWQLVTGAPSAISPRATTSAAAPSPTAAPSAPAPQAKVDKPLAVIRVSDYDPLGNGNENPEQAVLATDGSAATAWTTVTYRSDYLSGKDGVGLLLDLGAPRPISAVRLSLLGSGSDVKILTADRPDEDPTAFRQFAAASSAPGEIVLRSPKPVTARYVLVWLTRVPAQPDGGYQGGVSEVAVLG